MYDSLTCKCTNQHKNENNIEQCKKSLIRTQQLQHFLPFIPLGVTGGLEFISVSSGRRQGHSGQVISSSKGRHIQTNKNPVTQFRVNNYPTNPHMHVFGLLEEAGEPGEYPHRHKESMQTPHRNTMYQVQTQNLLAVRQNALI